uniref:RNA polymerase sigma factor RpoD/SigA n=1 Tax=Prevotella sp. GTC17253 TaxID=3236793 RepID=A0AB33IL98_9BACT
MRKIKTGKPLSEREGESLNLYLDEIGKEILLTAEEEQKLSEEVKAGNRRALDKLTTANLRFVVSVAKRYQDQGLGITDLISEGNLGLIKAAQNFDAAHGVRFVRFAEPYVRRAIERAVKEQSGIYRLPAGENSQQEQANSHPFSVDAPLVEGKKMSLLSVLKDESAPAADEHVLTESLRETLVEAMAVLDERERVVVEACFGINSTQLPMAEIGREMGLKRERVRQIRDKAVRKMLRNSDNGQLKSYLK